MLLVHFQLPEIDPGLLNRVSISFDVLSVDNGGIDTVLHGLGLRNASSPSALLGQQRDIDYDVGTEDAENEFAKLLSVNILQRGDVAALDVPKSREYVGGDDLLSYVRGYIHEGSAGNFLTFRFGSTTSLGCRRSSGSGCRFQRYQLDGNTMNLNLYSKIPVVAEVETVATNNCNNPCGTLKCFQQFQLFTCDELQLFSCNCAGCCRS